MRETQLLLLRKTQGLPEGESQGGKTVLLVTKLWLMIVQLLRKSCRPAPQASLASGFATDHNHPDPPHCTMISTGSAQFSPQCVCAATIVGDCASARHLGHSPPVLHHGSCCCCHRGQSPLCTDSLPRSNCFLNLDRIRSAVTGQLCEEMDLRNSLLCLTRCYCAISNPPSLNFSIHCDNCKFFKTLF